VIRRARTKNPDVSAPPPAAEVRDFGAPEVFVPQKVRAKKRFLVLAGTATLAGLAGLCVLLAYFLS
jgi:hypothetical protein